MPKLILLIICVLQVTLSRGQEPKQYFFKHYSSASGLISNQVNTTIQDKEWFMWIGSNNGLQRFDGTRYRNFRHKDDVSASLPSNPVSQLLINKNNDLWVLLLDGKAGIFNTKTFTYSPAKITTTNVSALRSILQIKKLVADEHGNLFLLLPGSELLTYNAARNEFAATNNFIPIPRDWKITDIIPQPGTHKYWLAVQGIGLAVYDLATEKMSYPGNNVTQEAIINNYNKVTAPGTLFFDTKGRFWFTVADEGPGYINCYDTKQHKVIIDKYRFVVDESGVYTLRTFFEQADGTVWIAGIKVFARYLEKAKQFEQVLNGYEEDNSIAYRIITKLSEDSQHNIWVGTGNNGLFRFNPSEEFFTSVKHRNHITGQYSDGSPDAFLEDKDGTILTGILGAGIYRFDRDMKEIPLGIKNIPDNNTISIWNMCYSHDSSFIWMAAQGGVYKYDVRTRVAALYSAPLLKGHIVRRVYEDRKGDLWLGMDSIGLFRWKGAGAGVPDAKALIVYTGIPALRVNKLVGDNKGNIWVGVFAEGAYVIDPVSGAVTAHFSDKASGEYKLPEQTVSSILVYNDSLVFISTSTRVVIYNRLLHKTTLLGNAETLSGFISSMEKDRNGHVWISTTTALHRYALKTKVTVQFNRDDGLSNDFFILSASHVLPDGRMIFGVSAWMIIFNPADIKLNNYFPAVYITDLKVRNRPLRVDSLLALKMVALDHDENSIAIDLSTFSYNTGFALKYRLLGLTDEWALADQNMQLVYSYLPPGKYTLEVRTLDTDGNSHGDPLRLAIRVSPPFYLTWWFFSLLALLVGWVVYRLDQERTTRIRAIQQVRSDIAGNLHREVNTTLNNISVLSEVANLKADKDIERSKEYIQQINSKSRHMIVALDDMLWSIDPLNDTMQKITERIREYIEGLNSRYNAHINMEVDMKVEAIRLDMQLRHDALLLFKDAIDVLIQSGMRDSKLTIGCDRSSLLYTVEFDNVPVDTLHLNNLLYSQEMERRIKAANAVLHLDLRHDHTMLQLKVPHRES